MPAPPAPPYSNVALPDSLWAWLERVLRPGDRVDDALELSGPDGALWALRLGQAVVVASAPSGVGQGGYLRRVGGDVAQVRYDAALVGGALEVAGERYGVGVGGGAKARAFAEAAAAAFGSPAARGALPAAAEAGGADDAGSPGDGVRWGVLDAQANPGAVPFAGTLGLSEGRTDGLRAALRALLEPGERLLACAQSATAAPAPLAPQPWWWVVTSRRAGRLAEDAQARRWCWEALASPSRLELTRGLTRTAWVRVVPEDGAEHGTEHGTGSGAAREVWLEGSGDAMRWAAAWSALAPGAERLLASAEAHIEAERWSDADALLKLAWADGRARVGEARVTEVLAQVALRRAQVGLERDDEAAAVVAFADASRRLAGDGVAFLEAIDRAASRAWLLTLAAGHERAERAEAAAQVYARLETLDPDGRAHYALAQARALARAERVGPALDAFARCLDALQADDDGAVMALDLTGDEAAASAASEPELVAACLESAALLESIGQHSAALARAIVLIRRAPYLEEGYRRAFALAERAEAAQEGAALDDDARRALRQAGAALRLLRPELAERLIPATWAASAPPALGMRVGVIPDEAHDAHLVHPSERTAQTSLGRRLGGWLSREQDTRDIERHCPRVDARSHPELATIVLDAAHMLNITAPRCYLSHSSTGVQVLRGSDGAPFMLLGACHLDPDHGRHLGPAELSFTVAAQLEHIRADHLILTSSEFWDAFTGRAIEGVATVLSMLPAASWLGKATDVAASGVLAKLARSLEGDTLRQALALAQKQIQGGKAGEMSQAALAAALDKLKALGVARGGAPPPDTHALLKEQLAAWARGALYSADRVGLLACGDLEAAVGAIFKLSSQAFEDGQALHRYGLAHILARRDARGAPVHGELALRLGELFKFALSPALPPLRARLLVASRDDTPHL